MSGSGSQIVLLQRNEMTSEFPQELHEEVISHLWDDLTSLAACSLTSKSLTVPSQRRLFAFINLTEPRRDINVGSSASFYELLTRSPHIARYVESLQISSMNLNDRSRLRTPVTLGHDAQDLVRLPFEDYKLKNGRKIRDLDAIAVTSNRDPFDTWLTRDGFLAACATLLPNLKSLDIIYNGSWGSLSFRNLIALLYLMRLPSLRYLRLECNKTCPISTVNAAMGSNIKYLVISASGGNEELPIQHLRPFTAPIYLEHFAADNFGLQMANLQQYRVQACRLRRLVIKANHGHFNTWTLLQSCWETLEDFQFTPCKDGKSVDPKVIQEVFCAITMPSQLLGCLARLVAMKSALI